MKADGHRQKISQDTVAQDSAYEAPRVVELGRSKDIIRGNANISNWDNTQGTQQWYQSGE